MFRDVSNLNVNQIAEIGTYNLVYQKVSTGFIFFNSLIPSNFCWPPCFEYTLILSSVCPRSSWKYAWYICHWTLSNKQSINQSINLYVQDLISLWVSGNIKLIYILNSKMTKENFLPCHCEADDRRTNKHSWEPADQIKYLFN